MSTEEVVQAAVDALAEARNVVDIKEGRSTLRRAIRGLRRGFQSTHGKLSNAFMEAMAYWDAMKAEGVLLEQRAKALEGVLRDVWPFTREWKYLCQNCSDTGLVIATCPGDDTCGDNPHTNQPRRVPHQLHEFGTPCWCSLGAKFKHETKPTPDDFTQAGRSKPTRIGRRN